MDIDMDIMEIVDMMEEAIEKAAAVPLTGEVMIDKGELLDYIREIRLVYPDVRKEAKWVKEERQRILSEAENRAEAIQKNAEETQMQLIDEHEITKALLLHGAARGSQHRFRHSRGYHHSLAGMHRGRSRAGG